MNIRFYVLFLLFSLVSLSVYGNKLTVYRWVDENNIVHFSQHQPDHDNYIEITMAGNKVASQQQGSENAAGNKTSISKTSQKNDTNEVLNNQVKKEGSNNLCETAKTNLETLQQFDNIRVKDTDGDERLLTPLEKEQQIAMNTKQVEVYCKQQ